MSVQRMCDPMLPALAHEFHASLADVAWVISMFAIAYGVMQIVYGPLADRIGKFRVVAFTTLMCSAGCLASALAPDLSWLVASRVLVAAFAAAIIPVSLAWVGDNTPYEIRQETLARVGLGTMLGLVSGQIIGGVFTDTAGWRWGFAFVGLLFLLAGSAMYSASGGRAAFWARCCCMVPASSAHLHWWHRTCMRACRFRSATAACWRDCLVLVGCFTC